MHNWSLLNVKLEVMGHGLDRRLLGLGLVALSTLSMNALPGVQNYQLALLAVIELVLFASMIDAKFQVSPRENIAGVEHFKTDYFHKL